MIKTLTVVVVLAVLMFGCFFILNKQSNETVNTTEKNTQNTESVKDDKSVVGSRVVNLSGQSLTKAPAYIFDMTDAQELDLSNNKLGGSLQAEVRFLQNLKILDLSDNQFTGVPAEIGQLKNLEVLNLSNNKLTGLPHELGNLSNLKILNLKGNDYASADLDIIKGNLSASTVVLVD